MLMFDKPAAPRAAQPPLRRVLEGVGAVGLDMVEVGLCDESSEAVHEAGRQAGRRVAVEVGALDPRSTSRTAGTSVNGKNDFMAPRGKPVGQACANTSAPRSWLRVMSWRILMGVPSMRCAQKLRARCQTPLAFGWSLTALTRARRASARRPRVRVHRADAPPAEGRARRVAREVVGVLAHDPVTVAIRCSVP